MRCGPASSIGSRRSARSTISCSAWHCGWRARSFENLDRPTAVYIDGASTLLEEVVQASGISTATLKALWRMVEEKQRLVRMLTEYIDGPGLTVVIGAEHNDPELRPFSLIAATYFDGAEHRHGRHHRPDAHALLEGDQRGGHRRDRRGPRAARRELDLRPGRASRVGPRHFEDHERQPIDPQDRLPRRPRLRPRGRGPAEALQKERDDLYDRLLRKTAEFDNFRKRVERDRKEMIEWAAADVIGDLLSIVDDFDRALAAPAPPGGAVLQGRHRADPAPAGGTAEEARRLHRRGARRRLRSAPAPGRGV